MPVPVAVPRVPLRSEPRLLGCAQCPQRRGDRGSQLDEHAGCSVAVTRYNKLGDSGLLVSELVSTLAAAFIIQSPSAPLG